ncbi:MAG TPA: STAS domain-containing protein [bacterium]|nr:STAS domain-containing protein [bacterium]
MPLSKEIKNNIGIVKIIGETNINTERKLIDLVKELAQKTGNNIILDLENCSYIDSGTLGAIILLNKYICSAGGKFCMANIKTETVSKLFTITKLYSLIPKYETVDEALTEYFKVDK